MADQSYSSPAGHYSGHNKIPTINKFLAALDIDKKDRDARIDAQAKGATMGTDAVAHQNSTSSRKGEKQVTDPVTGTKIEA